jgi:hypothetical protein
MIAFETMKAQWAGIEVPHGKISHQHSDGSTTLNEDVIQWCRENITDTSEDGILWFRYEDVVKVWIRDHREAMMFKLTWGGM